MLEEIQELGTQYKLSNCVVSRVDIDAEHYYFGAKENKNLEYFLSLTHVLDVGAPFPELLREYMRRTSYEEQKERLELTGARGSKLHDALERLMKGEALSLLEDYQSSYEKEAIASFIRTMRFLQPKKPVVEFIVADPDLRVAGTADLKCSVQAWRLEALLNPNKYLEIDSEGDYELKQRWLDMPKTKAVRILIDYKFTGRNAYNHKIQVAAYRTMNNKSRKDRVSRCFTWRFSPKHKFGFDFNESFYRYNSFKRIYLTAMEYLGEFPEPPELKIYPSTVRLFEEVIESEDSG